MFGYWNIIIKNKIKHNINFEDKISLKKTLNNERNSLNYLLLNNSDENVLDIKRLRNSFEAKHKNKNNLINKNKYFLKEEDNINDKNLNNANYSRNKKTNTSLTSFFKNEETDPIEANFSTNHKLNIFLTYMSLFVSIVSLFLVYPNIGSNLKNNIIKNNSINNKFNNLGISHSAWILSATPFGYIVGTLVYSLNKFHSYKYSLLISLILLSTGNFMYCIETNDNEYITDLIMIILSRFIIGLALFRISGRNYLIDYIPERVQLKYLERYDMLNIFSICMAFFLTAICSLYNKHTNLMLIIKLNNFTLSSFIIFILCLIMLVICIIYYTDPECKDFSIFNNKYTLIKNAYKTELKNKTTFSNISRGSLSKSEKRMIDNIDNKLSQINDENKFSDTNLVQKALINIVLKEKLTFGFFKQNFLLISFMLILSKTVFETLLIMIPLINWFSNSHKLDDRKSIDVDIYKEDFKHSMLMFTAILLIIPSIIASKYAFLKYELSEKKLLIIIEILIIIFLLLAMWTWTYIEALWINFFFIVLLSYLSEAINSSLLNKIVPVYFSFLCIKSSNVISTLSAISRLLIGIFIFLVCALFEEAENGEKIIFGLLLLTKISAFFCLYVSLNKIRIKAITKLIKQRKELKEEFET